MSGGESLLPNAEAATPASSRAPLQRGNPATPRAQIRCAADKPGSGLIVMPSAPGIPEPDKRLFFRRIRTGRPLVNIFF